MKQKVIAYYFVRKTIGKNIEKNKINPEHVQKTTSLNHKIHEIELWNGDHEFWNHEMHRSFEW